MLPALLSRGKVHVASFMNIKILMTEELVFRRSLNQFKGPHSFLTCDLRPLFGRLVAHFWLLRIIAVLILILSLSVSSWGMECSAQLGQLKTAKTSLTQLHIVARKVKTFSDLVSLSQQLHQHFLKGEEWNPFLQAIPSLPTFVNINDLRWSISNYSEKMTEEMATNELINQGTNWVKAGGDISAIQNSTFLNNKIKYLIFDQAAVKRSRPSHRALSPMEQNLIWETEGNFMLSEQRTSVPIPIEVKLLSANQVRISTAHSVPEWIRQLFFKGDTVLVPTHPFNREKKIVPFLLEKNSQFEWTGFLTASRTMILFYGKHAISIKMPTDYASPSNLNRPAFEKANMKEDVLQGIARSKHIEEIDQRIGTDPRLVVLKDVLAIADPKTGNGITARDLTPLMDGYLYLPGTATVNVMKTQGEEKLFEALKKSATNQGVGQALLLIRYGLVMEFPHRQNSLDRLNQDMEMLNTVVVRDMADTQTVKSIIEVLNPEMMEQDIQNNIKVRMFGTPNTQYVTALKGTVSDKFIENLENLLNSAYESTIATELGIPKGTSNTSPEFIEAMKRYHSSKHRR